MTVKNKPIETYSKLKIFVKEDPRHQYVILTYKIFGYWIGKVFDKTSKRKVALYRAKVSLLEFHYDMNDLSERYNKAEIK